MLLNAMNELVETYILGIRPGDAIVFVLSEEATEDDLVALHNSIEAIIGDKEDVTVAVFPERVVNSVKNLSLEDLLELKDEVEEAITNKAVLQSIGDA